jgi:transposase, IS30 family
MGQHYYHLSAQDRQFIERHAGRGPSWIGGQLGRPASAISREMRRNRSSGVGYDAVVAGQGALARRRRGLVKLAEGTKLRAHVFAQIRKGWSPQQISGKLKLMRDTGDAASDLLPPALGPVSHETIYRAIYVLPRGELRKEIIGLLRQGRKLRRPRSQGRDRRGGLKNMISIHERPESVLTRQLFGDWEGDLIKGEGNASAIGTLVERKSRLVILVKMKNCGADAALSGFERALNKVPAFARTSLAYDQGKEMAHHEKLARQLNLKVYFCDPHSPWQRPTNENMNGLVRQYLPKGLDLSIYSQKQLDRIAESLNTRPRAMHDFQTPQEVFNTEIQKARVALQI